MTTRHQGSWHKLIRSMLVSVTLYLVVCLFFIALFFSYAYPLVMGRIPGMKGSLLSFVLVLLIISPFLCAIIMKKNNSVEFRKLWADNRFNRGLLVSMIVIKVLICIIIVMGIIIRLFNVALGVRTDIIFPDHCRYLFFQADTETIAKYGKTVPREFPGYSRDISTGRTGNRRNLHRKKS